MAKRYIVFDRSNSKTYSWTELGMVRAVNKDRGDKWKKYSLKNWKEGWFHFVEDKPDGLICPEAIKEHMMRF